MLQHLKAPGMSVHVCRQQVYNGRQQVHDGRQHTRGCFIPCFAQRIAIARDLNGDGYLQRLAEPWTLKILLMLERVRG